MLAEAPPQSLVEDLLLWVGIGPGKSGREKPELLLNYLPRLLTPFNNITKPATKIPKAIAPKIKSKLAVFSIFSTG